MDNISEYYSDNVSLRMLLQLDPSGVGSAVDIYLTDIFEKYKKKKVKEFFSKIASGNVFITNEMINSDDFLFAFFSTTNYVLSTSKNEKIALFANLLINGIKSGEYKNDKYEQYLTIIDEITYLELLILEILYKFEEDNKNLSFGKEEDGKESNKLQKVNSYWKKFENTINERFNINSDILKDMLTRLNRTGLYETIIGSYWDYTGNRGTTTSLYNEFRRFVIDDHKE
jgi:hypothetical protein